VSSQDISKTASSSCEFGPFWTSDSLSDTVKGSKEKLPDSRRLMAFFCDNFPIIIPFFPILRFFLIKKIAYMGKYSTKMVYLLLLGIFLM
jgi:hypothetical protein